MKIRTYAHAILGAGNKKKVARKESISSSQSELGINSIRSHADEANAQKREREGIYDEIAKDDDDVKARDVKRKPTSRPNKKIVQSITNRK